MSEEMNEGQSEGSEVESTQDSAAEAQLEQIVGDKMADIFGDNEARNQRDESEQTGNETPENPDGLNVDEAAVATVDDEKPVGEDLTTENPTIAELNAAKDLAVEKGDYEAAIELRDRIKEAEAAEAKASKTSPDSKPAKGALTETERQILKATENWTEEDLNILEKNPEFARMTYRRVADKYNQLSLRYAQESARRAPAAQPGANPATVAQTNTLESLYQDLDKFSEVAGSELVERFIKPLKTEIMEPLKEAVAFVNESRQRAVATETTDTMGKIAVGEFAETYGKPESLTPGQQSNRAMLYDTADRILIGAKAHNVPMSVSEALNRAHLVLTAGQQIKASKATARKEIVSQVKRRSTQITSRPSQRLARLAPKSDKAAEAGVRDFWEAQAEA